MDATEVVAKTPLLKAHRRHERNAPDPIRVNIDELGNVHGAVGGSNVVDRVGGMSFPSVSRWLNRAWRIPLM
jgi:hypothetical protein